MKSREQIAIAADKAMDNIDPDASDEAIAGIVADYLMLGYRDTRHL